MSPELRDWPLNDREAPPRWVLDDARRAFDERAPGDELLLLVFDSLLSGDTTDEDVDLSNRHLLFVGPGLGVLVMCAATPNGFVLAGQVLTATRPEAIFLQRPGQPPLRVRVLPHGGFQSPEVPKAPVRLRIVPSRPGALAVHTEWVGL
ncbi:MAG: hypothetical protein WD271_05420 [Acidimicrobiia bacterium]